MERLNDSRFGAALRARWARAPRVDLDRRGAQLGAKAKNRSLRPPERVELTIIDEIKDRQDRYAAQLQLNRQRAQLAERSAQIGRLMEGPFADEQYEFYKSMSDDELRSAMAHFDRLRQGRAQVEDEVKAQVVRLLIQARQQKRYEERLVSRPLPREPLECVDCGSPTLLMDRDMRPRCACTLRTARSQSGASPP